MSNDKHSVPRRRDQPLARGQRRRRCAKACSPFPASSSCTSAARSNRFPSPGASPVRPARRWWWRIGGISASRRVWLPDEPRGGWWHEVVGPGLALDTQRFRILSFDYLGASADSTGPRDGAPFPTISAYDQAEAAAAAHQPSRHRLAARDCRRVVRRHGGAGVRRALSRSRRAPHRHQRRGSRASDGQRLARGAAAHREIRASSPASRRRAWSWRARWRWRPIAAPRNSRRASPARRGAMRRQLRACRSRNTCSRAAPNTRSATGPNPSCVCPNPSTCIASMPRASSRRSRRSRCARTSSCRWPTCAPWWRACRTPSCTRSPRCTVTMPS